MILVTHLNGTTYYLNADLIQSIESTPDTIISLTTREKLLVREKTVQVVERILEYQQRVHNPGYFLQNQVAAPKGQE